MARINVLNPMQRSTLKVSPAVFEEIELRLRLTSNETPFHLQEEGFPNTIDMIGIVIEKDLSIPATDPPITDLKSLLNKGSP